MSPPRVSPFSTAGTALASATASLTPDNPARDLTMTEEKDSGPVPGPVVPCGGVREPVNLCSQCRCQWVVGPVVITRGYEHQPLIPCAKHEGLRLRDARALCLGSEWECRP